MKPVKLGEGASRLLSVRARLVAFALLCAVPVLVLTGLQMRRDHAQVRTQAEDRARILAERLDMRVRLVLGASESVAHSIGALELARSTPGPACSLALQRALAAAGPLAADFTLSGPDGDVWCSALPHAGTRAGNRQHFEEAVATRRPVLSGITQSDALSRHMLLMAVPIIGLDGQVTAVASAALDGPSMTRGLLSNLDEANTAAVLLDRSGALVSRWPPRHDLRPGTEFAGTPLFTLLQQRQEVATEIRGLDGTQRLFSTRAVNHRGETVLWAAVGVDVESLEALSQAGRWRDLAIVLLVACAVVLVAVTATRPLVLARASALLEVARQVSRGDYGRRVPLRVRDELTAVEQALNLMLDAVEADRASLADSENRFRLLFEHSMDGVLQTLPDGTILAANPAACKLLGRNEAELISLRHHNLVDTADPRFAAMLKERSETGRCRAELTMLRGDGTPMEVTLSSSVFRDRHGRELNCVVFHDVTERNAARAQVLRLNRELEARVARRTQELEAVNRELEAFSYTVSHDLRAPVAVIRSFAEILEQRGALQDEKHLHYLRRIRASGQTMSDLIDGLLALAQISRAQLDWSVVDVSELAREVAQQLAEAEPARSVDLDIAPGMHAVADARLLRVVLCNLIGNAWKFTGRQPQARISVEMSRNASGGAVFCVRDNGDGFDPAYAHRLFVAFHRLHGSAEFPGLGIGLATVHRIVQRHGGRIWAEGRPGQGAAFYFELGSQDETASRAVPAATLGDRVAPL